MGLCLYNIVFIFSFENLYPESSSIQAIVEIIELKEEKEFKNKNIVKILKIEKMDKKQNFNKYIGNKLILYTEKENNFNPGDIIYVKGNFEKAEQDRNYKGFNYRNYLKQKRIYGIINSEIVVKKGIQKDIFWVIGTLKINLYSKLDEMYQKEYAEFLKGILFGDTKNLDDKIKEDFRDSSISHILAISGMHVTYIVIGVKFILEKLIKNNKLKNYILCFLLIVFVIFTGGAVSSIRAVCVNFIHLVSINFYKKDNFYLNMFISFMIILLINPYNIFNIGMWLSYAGTIGIVIFLDFFIKLINKKYLKSKNNIIIQYLFTSISAQIFIFPIILYVFNTGSLTFFISNILVSFFIGPIIGIGYIVLIFSYFFNPFLQGLVKFEEGLIFIIFKISEFCSKLPFSKIYLKTPTIYFIVIYYAIIFYIIKKYKNNKIYFLKIFFSKKYLKKFLANVYKKIKLNKFLIYFLKVINLNRKIYSYRKKKIKSNFINCKIINLNIYKTNKMNRINKYKKNNIRRYRGLRDVFILVLIFLIIIILIFKQNQILKIYFIDVGQGDSTLIRTPKGKSILIDGGDGNSGRYDYGEKVLMPYLLDRRIDTIDYLIISHMDSDHVGGLLFIIENLKVNNIFIGVQPEESEELQRVLELSRNKKIPIHTLKKDMKINIEIDIYIDVLFPDENNIINENKLNNNSLVFKFIYKNFSILFTGDIEEIAEKTILENYKNLLKANILKVAHHGSKTSSTIKFLNEVKPQIALIRCW